MCTLIKWYSPFSALFLLTYAVGCKSTAAAEQIEFIAHNQEDKQEQKAGSISNTKDTDQPDSSIAAEASFGKHNNSPKQKNNTLQTKGSKPRESLKKHLGQPYQVDDAPPSFSLQDITIKAGTPQPAMLESIGNTEGYSVKSISVTKNGAYYTKGFGITNLNKKSIPSSGLPFTLTADPMLRVGLYLLSIKLGKTGKDSRQTEQWVKCNIHVINEVKNDRQNRLYSTEQTIQTSSSGQIDQNGYLNQQEADTSKNLAGHSECNHTIPIAPSFTLKNITIKAGKEHPITLAATSTTEGYIIQSIAIKNNKN